VENSVVKSPPNSNRQPLFITNTNKSKTKKTLLFGDSIKGVDYIASDTSNMYPNSNCLLPLPPAYYIQMGE